MHEKTYSSGLSTLGLVDGNPAYGRVGTVRSLRFLPTQDILQFLWKGESADGDQELHADFSVQGSGVLVVDTFYSFRATGRIKRGRNPHQNNSHHQVFNPTAALREPSATVFKNKA